MSTICTSLQVHFNWLFCETVEIFDIGTEAMGRPTKRNQKLIDKLLLGLEAGRYENELCAELDVHPTNVRIWKRKDPELREMVNEARRDGILARLEADKLALEAAISRDDILRAKECLAHSRWEAEKLLKDFQPIQKSEVTHSGPMIIGWENEIKPTNEGAEQKTENALIN